MTATLLRPEDVAHASRLATQIGEAFRRGREAHGHRIPDVAAALGMSSSHHHALGRFERGARTDVKLSTIVRNLGVYGYTLAVVPIDNTATVEGR